MKDIKTKDIQFDGEKYGYNQSYINLRNWKMWNRRLNDILRLGYSSGKLLDIGCNYGFFLKKCEPYFKTYGIDISHYAVFQAKKYTPKSQIIFHDIQKKSSI